jgi:hypothetical protein
LRYKTETSGEKLVIDYTRLNLFEIQDLDLDVYLFYMREAFIHKMNQTKEGREYLENCWRMQQSKPDRKKLREKYRKGG